MFSICLVLELRGAQQHHNMVPLALEALQNNPSSGYLYSSWGNAIQKILANLLPKVQTNIEGHTSQNYIIIAIATFMVALVAWMVYGYCMQVRLGRRMDHLASNLVLVRELAQPPKANIGVNVP